MALEEPVDARATWQRQKQGRREGTGTAFRLGVYYAFALAALPSEYDAPLCQRRLVSGDRPKGAAGAEGG